MKTLILILAFAAPPVWSCELHLMLAQVDNESAFKNLKRRLGPRAEILQSFEVDDRLNAPDDFGPVNRAVLIRSGNPEMMKELASLPASEFQNLKILCGKTRVPFVVKRGERFVARLMNVRSDEASEPAAKTMRKFVADNGKKFGLFVKAAFRAEDRKNIQNVNDVEIFGFEKASNHAYFAKDPGVLETERLYNKIYATNYLALLMKPL